MIKYNMISSNRKRRWTIEQLRNAVENSSSYRQVLSKLKLRPAGGNYDQLKKYISEYKISIKHFTGKVWNKGLTGIGKPRIEIEKILTKNSYYQSFKLKKRLFAAKLKPMYCEECGWKQRTQDGFLPLELHHVNGNRHDNRLINLLILCPNCHSLKSNHRGRGGKPKSIPIYTLRII